MTNSPYRTASALAWRNMMVAGINAGLEQGLFGLNAGDNRWPCRKADEEGPGVPREFVYHFMFPGGVPAVAYVGDAGFDELAINVALWPTPQGAERVKAHNAKFLAGEAFAIGWLERQEGPWLQTGRSTCTCRRRLLKQVAAAQIDPVGYADNGQLFI